MIVNRESRHYSGAAHVWVGKYKNLTNLPHWHSDCEIFFVEEGNATANIEGKSYELSEGDSVFIDPSAVHQIKGGKNSTLSFFIFDSEPVKHILTDRLLRSPILSCEYGLPALFSAIEGELKEEDPLAALSVNNRIERLVLDIFRREETEARIHEENFMETRYKLLLKDIDEKYADYTITDAARFVALSESYFSKFFKHMAHMTFTQYLNLVRVEKAIEFIHKNEDTVTKIAISCGFGTIRNFNRVFKSITGYSPRELPATYNTLSMHPTYGIEDTFDPTSSDSVLI